MSDIHYCWLLATVLIFKRCKEAGDIKKKHFNTHHLIVCRCVCNPAERLIKSCCLSVCMHACSKSRTAERIFVAFKIGELLQNLFTRCNFGHNQTTTMGTSHENIMVFLHFEVTEWELPHPRNSSLRNLQPGNSPVIHKSKIEKFLRRNPQPGMFTLCVYFLTCLGSEGSEHEGSNTTCTTSCCNISTCIYKK